MMVVLRQMVVRGQLLSRLSPLRLLMFGRACSSTRNTHPSHPPNLWRVMSKTNGKSLPELKRDQAKLAAIILAEEQEQALKKRARERELVRSSGKVLVPASPSKSPREYPSQIKSPAIH